MLSEDLKRISIILPSLNPDEKLQRTVDSLLEVGFSDIILVNDGSSAECLHFFPAADEQITLLTHEVNRGKGAGLKTAFRYLLENRPDSLGAITVDGDGQHAAKDVLRCAEAMLEEKNAVILGCRDFSLPHVPKKSRYGNHITSTVFKIFCGLKISDTQTGLRAVPAKYYATMTEVSGDRFEYETNMLLEMKARGIPYREIQIETVYIEENKTSHFRPFVDSVRIYSLILKFVASSMISYLFEAVLLWGLLKILSAGLSVNLESGSEALTATAACTITARICSSLLNFTLNRKSVFHAGGSLAKNLLRYYTVAVPMMLIYAGATSAFKWLLGADTPLMITLVGAGVSILLYFVSFRLQQNWVFGRKSNGNE